MLQGGSFADSSEAQPALVLQVVELKHTLAAQQREAELSRRNQELQAQLMLRDLEARLTAAPATSKTEASTQFKVRLCLAVRI